MKKTKWKRHGDHSISCSFVFDGKKWFGKKKGSDLLKSWSMKLKEVALPEMRRHLSDDGKRCLCGKKVKPKPKQFAWFGHCKRCFLKAKKLDFLGTMKFQPSDLRRPWEGIHHMQIVPMPKGFERSFGSLSHDMASGPCECGGWHDRKFWADIAAGVNGRKAPKAVKERARELVDTIDALPKLIEDLWG